MNGFCERRPPRWLVSTGSFLASESFRGIRKAAEAPLYSPSFGELATPEDRIDAALSVQHLPLLQPYERAVSFYHRASCRDGLTSPHRFWTCA